MARTRSHHGLTACPRSVAELLAATVARHPERPAARSKGGDGSWTRTSWLDLGRLVVAGASWFADRPGAIGLVVTPSVEATAVQLAAFVAGRSVQSIYPDADRSEIASALAATGVRTVVVDASTAHTVEAAARASVDVVDTRALVASWRTAAGAEPVDGSGFQTAAVVGALAAWSKAAGSPSLYLQSSGTTGPARVIDLPVDAVLAATWAVRDTVDHGHPRFAAILPAGHISHHLINVFTVTLLAGEVAYGGGTDTLVEDLRAVRPTVLFGSPLLYAEIEAEIRRDLGRTGRGRRLLARLDRERDRRLADGEIRRGDVSVLGRLVGHKAARAVGLHRARELFSGTSPLDADSHAFLAGIGWYVRNTYGVSECGGAATISDRRSMVPGELGRPVESMQVRAAPDGELVLAGPSVMRGYLGEPVRAEQTELRTGDLAVRMRDTWRFECRTSRILFAGPERVNLDVVERTAAAALGAGAVVVASGRRGLEVYVLGERFPAVAEVLDALPLALVEQVAGVAAVGGALEDVAGVIGPTGKVRRWRVQDHWGAQLRPLRTPTAAAA